MHPESRFPELHACVPEAVAVHMPLVFHNSFQHTVHAPEVHCAQS